MLKFRQVIFKKSARITTAELRIGALRPLSVAEFILGPRFCADPGATDLPRFAGEETHSISAFRVR